MATHNLTKLHRHQLAAARIRGRAGSHLDGNHVTPNATRGKEPCDSLATIAGPVQTPQRGCH